MFNFLIVEDNIDQCNQIINYISEHNSNLRLYYMAHCGKDALNIINKEIVDIILLDLKLPDISGIDIINYISEKNIEKYNKSIILISGEAQMLLSIIKSPYVYTYFTKPIDLEKISECLNNIIKSQLNEMNKDIILDRINEELHTLNFNFSYVGTKYLRECIYELYITNDNHVNNLSKKIYPIIAKRHFKTPNNIHSNIKQSIQSMYYDCEEKIIIDYFKYSYCVKPRAKEIIFTILNKIKYKNDMVS